MASPTSQRGKHPSRGKARWRVGKVIVVVVVAVVLFFVRLPLSYHEVCSPENTGRGNTYGFPQDPVGDAEI